MNRITFSGRFTLHAVKPDGTRRVLADWFDNLILDNGLNRMGTLPPLARCSVGSGSAAVVASQQALAQAVATTSTIQDTTNGNETASGYSYARVTYRFAQGTATGNLNEVGVGFSNNTLFSRALIVDSNGTPTTVTVLADEALDVTYELRLYWPTTDATGSVVLDGITYNFTLRASQVGSWTNLALLTQFDFASYVAQIRAITGGTLGTIEQPSGGSTLAIVNAQWASYAENSQQRAFSGVFGLSSFTQSFDKLEIVHAFMGIWKIEFSAPIPKTALNTLVLNFVLSWTRRSI